MKKVFWGWRRKEFALQGGIRKKAEMVIFELSINLCVYLLSKEQVEYRIGVQEEKQISKTK